MSEARLTLDPRRAAQLEVEWWRVHREHQHDGGSDVPLVDALSDLYAYVYATGRDAVRQAAHWRVVAMDYSEDPQTAPQGGDLGWVPLSALTKMETKAGPVAIEQFNQLNSATLSALPSPGVTSSEGLAAMREAAAHVTPPRGAGPTSRAAPLRSLPD